MIINLTQAEQDYIKSQYIERLINLEVENTIDGRLDSILDSTTFDKLINDRLTVLTNQGFFDELLKTQFSNLIQDKDFLENMVENSTVYDLLAEKLKQYLKAKL